MSGTTTSAGNGGGTTVIDVGIPNAVIEAQLRGKWLLVTSGARSGEARVITSSSSGTVTTAAFSGQVASGVTYEILAFAPALYLDATQAAVRQVYPDLYLPLKNEQIIVDNLLANSGFGGFTTTFTSWTNIGTPTLAQSSENGATGAEITASGAVEGIEQDVLSSLNYNVEGKSLQARGWVKASAADAARIRVTFDGTTYTSGPFHTGSALWESPTLHRLSATIPADATEATVSCEVADGETATFDLVTAWVDPITIYTLPTTFINGPHKVFQQTRLDRPNGEYLPLGPRHAPRSGHILRLETMGRLTVPTADADEIEVDEERAELIVAMAAKELFRILKRREPGTDYAEEEARWANEAERLRRRPGLRMTPLSAHKREGWSYTSDADGSYLLLGAR